jgi:integrase
MEPRRITVAGRRGNNEGTINKRSDGRWQAIVSTDDGKRKYFYGKTRQEVAKRLSEALHELDRGLPMLDERQTCQQYLETWIETVKPQIRSSSWRRYSDYVRVHLVPGLGRIPLAKLTPQHVQLFYARKLSEGLSTSTVHHVHGVLHRALKDALLMGLVQRNVTEMVRAPRRSSREMMTLTDHQAKLLLEVVKGERFEALYLLALTTGMRLGELLGLRWQDLDLERRMLQVRVNVQEFDGRFVIAETKTAYSRRSIGLTPTAIESLRRHRAGQNEDRLALGLAWDNTLDLVFPNRTGGIMIPDNLTKRYFKEILRKLGFSEEIRFHDLRHTAATLLLSRGVNPKVVSEMLGHADISITLRVYAHVTPHMQEAAIFVMENLFGAAEA